MFSFYRTRGKTGCCFFINPGILAKQFRRTNNIITRILNDQNNVFTYACVSYYVARIFEAKQD